MVGEVLQNYITIFSGGFYGRGNIEGHYTKGGRGGGRRMNKKEKDERDRKKEEGMAVCWLL